MDPITPIGEFTTINNGYERAYVILPNKKVIARARLVMMNFLHTNHLPTKLHVHHINEFTMDDRIENLIIVNRKIHQSIHHPKDYRFGASYSENPTEYERGRRKQPHIRKAEADTSLRWYHRNKESVNNNVEKKEYKRSWYFSNKENILGKMKQRYLTDEVYREKCIKKAEKQKQKRRERKSEII